jgi:hypothetical protein
MPIPYYDPDGNPFAPASSRATKVLAVVRLVLMSLVVAFGVFLYVSILIDSYHELDGFGIGFMTILLVGLLIGWWRAFRSVRQRLGLRHVRWAAVEAGRVRRGRGRIGTLIRLTVRRRSGRRRPRAGQGQRKVPRAPGISAPRTDLRPGDIADAQRPQIYRTGVPRPPAPPIAKLSGIERTLGDVLYQLDLSHGRHELTRSQLTAIRETGLRASAWLADHDHRVDPVGHDALGERQIAKGIAYYEDLARTAADVLADRATADVVLVARRRLDAIMTPTPTPTP